MDLRDWTAIVGLTLVAVGVWLIAPAASLCLVGGVLFWFGVWGVKR